MLVDNTRQELRGVAEISLDHLCAQKLRACNDRMLFGLLWTCQNGDVTFVRR
jgi:hypothetical protein